MLVTENLQYTTVSRIICTFEDQPALRVKSKRIQTDYWIDPPSKKQGIYFWSNHTKFDQNIHKIIDIQ
jgi:hypothetical protein